MFEVIDRKTQLIVGKYKTLRTASRAVMRLDNAYGACRYHYRRIEA